MQTRKFCLLANRQDAELMFSKIGDFAECVDLESVRIVIEALKYSCLKRKDFIDLFLFKSIGEFSRKRASYVIFHDCLSRSLKDTRVSQEETR